MKRIGTTLLLLVLAGGGCMPLRVSDDQPKPPTTRLKSKDQAPPVMPEDVNEDNGPEMAKRLWAEIKSDGQPD